MLPTSDSVSVDDCLHIKISHSKNFIIIMASFECEDERDSSDMCSVTDLKISSSDCNPTADRAGIIGSYDFRVVIMLRALT